jgi:hypothetical protein
VADTPSRAERSERMALVTYRDIKPDLVVKLEALEEATFNLSSAPESSVMPAARLRPGRR